MPGGAGYVNQGNQPVLKVVPFDQLLARVEIPSTDIGFVRIGQPVDISIDSFPATDFGVLKDLSSKLDQMLSSQSSSIRSTGIQRR